jgi:hypothetical protein
MNELPPKDEHERNMRNITNWSIGWRPLRGTNLEWLYRRDKEDERKKTDKRSK